jgi:hypothetical protein
VPFALILIVFIVAIRKNASIQDLEKHAKVICCSFSPMFKIYSFFSLTLLVLILFDLFQFVVVASCESSSNNTSLSSPSPSPSPESKTSFTIIITLIAIGGALIVGILFLVLLLYLRR